MPRKLSAIEIAEGALLADVAVIFQLLATYLPIAGDWLRLFTPIIFAILVLRRGFYVGMIGLCVAVFIVGIMTGHPAALALMIIECGAGLFLGLTMKHRLGNFAILFLGVTSSSIIVYGLIILLPLLLGIPFNSLILGLHKTYTAFVSVLGSIAPHVGLGDWWKHSAYPLISWLANLAFTYWLAFFYVATWVVLWPVVMAVHYITNLFVRLLGYDVRPFPGGRINKLLRWITRKLIKVGIRRGIIGRHRVNKKGIAEITTEREKVEA